MYYRLACTYCWVLVVLEGPVEGVRVRHRLIRSSNSYHCVLCYENNRVLPPRTPRIISITDQHSRSGRSTMTPPIYYYVLTPLGDRDWQDHVSNVVEASSRRTLDMTRHLIGSAT
jgi:hypothetical protein